MRRSAGYFMLPVQERDDEAAGGRFVLTLLAALAEMERDQVSERTREAMNQLVREKRVRSGRLPFGFRTEANPESTRSVAGDRSQMIRHEGEQRLLRRMLLLADEGLGARRIARALNDEGLVNPRTGRAWRPSSIQKILATAARSSARSR